MSNSDSEVGISTSTTFPRSAAFRPTSSSARSPRVRRIKSESLLGRKRSFESYAAPTITSKGIRFPLAKDEIRLFIIMLLDRRNEIEIYAFPFKRDNAPKYHAISYVCGDDKSPQTIIANGCHLLIRKSLHVALHEMRELFFEWGYVASGGGNDKHPVRSEWLWADELCINQEDLVEKSRQILGMHAIYRNAAAVLVSLGTAPTDAAASRRRSMALFCTWNEIIFELAKEDQPGLSNSDSTQKHRAYRAKIESLLQREWSIGKKQLDAMHEAFAVCYRYFRERPRDETGWDDVELRLERVRQEAQLPPQNHPFWQSCLDIFEHEWFSRLWTFQETRLANSGLGPELILGSFPVGWDTIGAVWVLLYRCFGGSKGRLSGNENTLRWFRLQHGEDKFNDLFRFLGSTTDPIWKLFGFSCQRRATVGHDHVFGLVGLMRPGTRERIVIDYSKPKAQVFADALALAIELERGYCELPRLWEALSHVPATTPGLPSWCPDFGNETYAYPASGYAQRVAAAVYEAYGEYAEVEILPTEMALALDVLVLDTVAQTTDLACPDFGFVDKQYRRENVASVRKQMRKWFKRLHLDFTDSSAVEDTEAELFAFLSSSAEEEDCLPISRLGPETGQSSHTPPVRWLMSVRQAIERDENPTFSDGEVTSDTLDYLSSLGYCSFAGSYIFKTMTGWFGYSPTRPSVGDYVCLVPYGRRLHIISADKMRYVGAASVDGLMDEDVFEIVQDEGLEFEEVVLY